MPLLRAQSRVRGRFRNILNLIGMGIYSQRLYNRLATRMVRKTRSETQAGLLPIGIFLPDLPVPKRRPDKKLTVADASINDGLHMHGIVLGNKWGRMKVRLDEHFEENKDQYRTEIIRNIDVKPIVRNFEYVVGYALKGLIKRTASLDDLLVLNWGGRRTFSEQTRRHFIRYRRFVSDLTGLIIS